MSFLTSATARPDRSEGAPGTDGGRDLEVVPGPRRSLRFWTVLIAVLAVGVLFGLVAFQALIVRNQGTLDDLGAQIEHAQRTNAILRLEVAELSAPERVRSIALAMGMVKPDTIVYLEPISADVLGESAVIEIESGP